MNATNEAVTYEPDNSLRKGYFQLVGEIVLEFKSNRWLTYQLFRRSFFSMYKQSFIGALWIIILPIVQVGIFALLNNSGIFSFGDITVPYPIYAICGMSFWQIFATGLNSCGSSLTSAGEMITRINFSKKSLVIAPMGKTVVSFAVQLFLVGALFIFYRITPSINSLLIPIVVVPILLFTVGCGFIVAILNAIVRDTGNLLTLGITFLMYLTPVLYAKPTFGILAYATKFNPMYYLVSAGRDLMVSGRITEMHGFLWSALISVIIFCAALIVFHLTETRIAERI